MIKVLSVNGIPRFTHQDILHFRSSLATLIQGQLMLRELKFTFLLLPPSNFDFVLITEKWLGSHIPTEAIDTHVYGSFRKTPAGYHTLLGESVPNALYWDIVLSTIQDATWVSTELETKDSWLVLSTIPCRSDFLITELMSTASELPVPKLITGELKAPGICLPMLALQVPCSISWERTQKLTVPTRNRNPSGFLFEIIIIECIILDFQSMYSVRTSV